MRRRKITTGKMRRKRKNREDKGKGKVEKAEYM
jgi:hypothetical protein